MADDKSRSLLREWGLSEDIVEKFKENDIDLRALHELKEDDVAGFFNTLGQKLRFRSGLKSLHPAEQPVIIGIGPDVSYEGSSCTEQPILGESDVSNDLAISDLNSTCSSYSCSLPSTSSNLSALPILSSTPVKQESSSSLNSLSQTTPLKKTVETQPIRSSPRLKAKWLKESQQRFNERITADNLKELLNERIVGKVILNQYAKYGRLNHINQVNLAKFIVDVEWSYCINSKIETHRFLELREVINEVFPSEDQDLYYVPYKNFRNGKKLSARGKLYDQYHELRRTLINTGLLRSNKSKKALNFTVDDYVPEYDEVTIAKYEWLTKASQPLKQAEKYWKDTYTRRHEELEKHNSIATYLSTFPVLKENCGYSFLVSDFSEKYHENENSFIASWPFFKESIISYVKESCPTSFIESLKIYSIDIDSQGEHESTVAALRLLAILLPTMKGIKTPSKSYKPSKFEVVDSMILIAKSDADIKNVINERRAFYAKLKLPIQPITVVVYDGSIVKRSYVVIENIEYFLTSPMVAADVCFKCIFALNAQYPVESKLAWLFIQKYVYGIETPYDGTYVAVKTLHNALSDFQKKNQA